MGIVVDINERAIGMAEHIDFGEPIVAPVEPVTCSLSIYVRRLEALVGADRWTLQKVRMGDYEVRTYAPAVGPLKDKHGQVGRGHTATDAIADLVSQLGEVTYSGAA
jgi:hypothetical protein